MQFIILGRQIDEIVQFDYVRLGFTHVLQTCPHQFDLLEVRYVLQSLSTVLTVTYVHLLLQIVRRPSHNCLVSLHFYEHWPALVDADAMRLLRI